MKTIVNIRKVSQPFHIKRMVVLLMVLCFSVLLHAQNSAMHPNLTKAIQTGNAKLLAEHFNATIDLTLPNNEGTYSKKQAEQILKMFFDEHPSSAFTLDHSGKSNDGSSYMIGTLKTKTNKTFRVYFLVKSVQGKNLIQQLQFDTE